MQSLALCFPLFGVPCFNMKKVRILCVGKIKENYLREGIAEFSKRLSRFCSLTITEINDCAITETALKRESDEILSKLDGSCFLMDIGGEQLSSEQLSKLFDSEYLSSDCITIIIGGSQGVSESVKKSVKGRISFGKVTYPHQLMRLIVLEQVYRAFNILEGTPYHK